MTMLRAFNDIQFTSAKVQNIMTPMRVVSNYLETQTGAPRSYSFFNAPAGFVFAARSVCQRTEKSENVIFFQVEYLKM